MSNRTINEFVHRSVAIDSTFAHLGHIHLLLFLSFGRKFGCTLRVQGINALRTDIAYAVAAQLGPVHASLALASVSQPDLSV